MAAAARALRVLGFSCLYLMVDDQLQVHETVLPAWGVAEPLVFIIYGVVAGVLALRVGRAVLALPHVPALLLGLVLLGLSIALDVIRPPIPGPSSLEESTKLLGLVGLTVFSLRTAMTEGRRSTPPPEHVVK